MSRAMYATHIACTLMFNSTSFVVMLLLDSMPTLSHSTKAGALIIFLVNVILVWVTDRFVLATDLKPQVRVFGGTLKRVMWYFEEGDVVL